MFARFDIQLYAQAIRVGFVIALDIGANTGLFSIAATVNPELEVHAYEIVPEVAV